MIFRIYHPKDYEKLYAFLQRLPESITKDFAPHIFEHKKLKPLLHHDPDHLAFLAFDHEENILSYQALRKDFLPYEKARFLAYGISPDRKYCSYAPMVHEAWQGNGLGRSMFGYISGFLKAWKFDHIVLWGGGKQSNHRALAFYERLGFYVLGSFLYEGNNLDMIFDLNE